jgi:outer membrane protein with beta-barrel domain
MRSWIPALSAAAVLCLMPLSAVPCAAQGFGLGARLSMIRTDVNSGTGAERFTGGHIRTRMSPRTGFELSLDVRTQRNETLTERVRDMPIQASLLLFPARGAFSPYLLGGGGWYSHRVESLAGGEVLTSETTRKFGWHGGFGAELRMGRHAGIHADYRYTFLHFGSSSDPIATDTIAGAIAASASQQSAKDSRFLPNYDGSMWTAGVTVYF